MRTLKIILIFTFLFIFHKGDSQYASLFNEDGNMVSAKISPFLPEPDSTPSFLPPPCSPSATNDNCAGAVTLTAGASALRGTLCNSSTQAGEPISFCGSSINNNSVWYSFQATAADMYVDVNQLSGNCFIAVAVYGSYATSTGGCIPSASQRMACFGAISPIEKVLRLNNLTVNGWYMVQVGVEGGSCGNNGNYTFTVHVNTLQNCATCSSDCGSAKEYSTPPANYQQLKNDGACYPMRPPNDTIQKHFSFVPSEESVSFNAGWYATGGCSGFASVSFSLYDNCGLMATNSNGNFSGLTIGAAYTINYNLRMSSPCNVDTFAPYFVLPAPMPVSLLYFRAEIENGNVVCRWATVNENGSDFFFVERSVLGESAWQTVASVKASGNSGTEKKYAATDDALPEGKLYYRLKQTDKNGSVTYSQIVSLEHRMDGDDRILCNSGNNLLTVYLPVSGSGALFLVYDLFGRILYSKIMAPGTINTIDCSRYIPGIYHASLRYENGNKLSKSFFMNL